MRTKEAYWDSKHDGTDFCMIAVGNKCDLRDYPNFVQHGYRDTVDIKKANEWFKEKRVPYIETSAKNGRNVHFLFRHSIYEYWIQSHSGCLVVDS